MAGDSLDGCRVLIVEDDPLISSHLEAIVARTIDADVVISASVAEANAALANPFDFAFLDVDVLDGTTYAVAATLSAKGVPFSFVSASNRDLMPAELKDASFIAKPYCDADIAAMIRTGVQAG